MMQIAINKLDKGFTLSISGKKFALESKKSLLAMLEERL